MPTIIKDGYKFHFYSSDIKELQIHGDHVAKFWLESFDVEYNHGYNKPELNKIVKLTRENMERLLAVWNDYISR